ncbi:tyrosine-type recombinase/integrase [Candidatus Pacearchaeota archaeon]|nr:tyrosine-type recombinase/integrase [Candidatus Pacearchaeota archaeon]
MKREINVYNFEKRKKKIKEVLDTLPPKNKNDIERFCMNLLTEGKAEATYFKYLERLPQIAFLLNKEFKEVTREDLERLFEKLITENSYAKNTIGTYKLMTRRFFQWLHGYKKNQYPPVVEWIEANVHHRKLVRPEDLLTGEDIQKMISVAFNPRDKAFVAVLAESGCRISEILTLRIRSINFDIHGAVFVVSGKTGERIVRVINAVPYLNAWLKHHPEKDDGDSPLWVVLGNCKYVAKNGLCDDYKHVWRYNLCYSAAASVLKKLAKRAGIKKPVNPHNFRHSRATSLAVAGLNPALMNEVMGWSQHSTMSSTYLHISRQQTESILLSKVYGIKIDESDSKPGVNALPLICINCGTKNYHDSKYCSLCNQRIGIMAKEDIEKENINNQILRAVSGLVGENGDLKKALIESLKKEIMEEIMATQK